MNGDLLCAKALLEKESYTCVIRNNGETLTSRERGVKTLVHLLDTNPEILKGASIADSIIGKAAALLMILGGVKEVYTRKVSCSALLTFKRAGVPIFYDEEVPYIINRTRTGRCPMETLCMDIDDPQVAFEAIKEKLADMKS